MNRLEAKFKELKRSSKKALVAYLTAGYPGAGETVKLAELFENNGADILELGVPFSDPIADGRTIQYASQTALKKGMTLSKVFGIVRDIRKRSDIPIVLMGYLNPFLRHGFDAAMKEAGRSGVDGMIIPDAIPEESSPFMRACAKNGLSLIHLAAPNTPEARLRYIDRASSGFVYIVSIAGVTGARKELPAGIKKYLALTKKAVRDNPRIIGFGISGPRQVRELRQYVDGFIVASAMVEIIKNSGSRKKAYSRLARFLRSLRQALDN